MDTEESIMKVLENLLEMDEILACMVVRKSMEGIMPDASKFDEKVIEIWELLQETMENFFVIIENYSKYSLEKIEFSILDYDVLFFILPETDTALVSITSSLANKGLIEVSLERSRRKILKILE